MVTYFDRLQTASGKLTVDDDAILLERPGFPQARLVTLARSSITSVMCQAIIRPTFGRFGGAARFVFAGVGGERLQVNSVPWKAAMQLCDVLRIKRP